MGTVVTDDGINFGQAGGIPKRSSGIGWNSITTPAQLVAYLITGGRPELLATASVGTGSPLPGSQNHGGLSPRGARHARGPGDPAAPKYPPDWSIKFNAIAPNAQYDELTIDQLLRLKDEAYNRYRYFEYEAQATQLQGGDSSFFQSMSDRWGGTFRQVDTALKNAQVPVHELNSFLADKVQGPLVYGQPYAGPSIGEPNDPQDTPYPISRPYGQGVENAFLVAFGGSGSPTAPELPDVGDDTGYTQGGKLPRAAVNPDVATNERVANRIEAAATVAQAGAAGFNELLNGGTATVHTWTDNGMRYVQVVSEGTMLSVGQARYVLSHWARTPDQDLPNAPNE